ncbi:YigZ family protein [Neptunicella marina]|uniref:YigZ family protein n=1 Tax=Neptunicella marina TaxID=2125989 RepID=A0A8J6IU97_9ALTE|nr:YigZ family protein [Neptunicella marina]MBC3766801.1 YigZ family protein [Neptunicella marina]
MTKTSYAIPATEHQIEIEINKSKFIAIANHAANKSTADLLIKTIRAQHPTANHVCWAFIASSPTSTIRSMSDDGEPSGTAGKPMLAVLEHSGLGEICVCVVRYFGGVKLGKGGLQRAYSGAVSQVLKDLPHTTYEPSISATCEFAYEYDNHIQKLLQQFSVKMISQDFTASILLTIDIPLKHKTAFYDAVINATAGAASITFADI